MEGGCDKRVEADGEKMHPEAEVNDQERGKDDDTADADDDDDTNDVADDLGAASRGAPERRTGCSTGATRNS